MLAVIGSPSSTTQITLNLLTESYRTPVYGQLVGFTHELLTSAGSHRELAIGTITRVETINPFHAATAVEAFTVAQRGAVGNRTGDTGDVRVVTVGIEAVFRQTGDGAVWTPAGATLSTSPATGTPVELVDQALVDQLMAEVPGRRWLGHLRGGQVLVPFTESDFSGARGSRHGCIAGATGSGKSAVAAYRLACDLFHDQLGHIILDPQGQWAGEVGMVFSLQGLAEALGRTVTVARLSRSLRLRKDAPMMLELLARSGWFTELSFGAGAVDQVANACRSLDDAIDDKRELLKACGTEEWTEADPARLMAYLLEALREVLPLGTIYAGPDGQKRVANAIRKPTVEELIEAGEVMDAGEAEVRLKRYRDGILDQAPTGIDPTGGKRWRVAYGVFAAITNLWSPYTPEGALKVWQEGVPADELDEVLRRRKAWPLLAEVFRADPSRPAPWLILDLSADTDLRGTAANGGDEETAAQAEKTRQVLDHPGVKARILRQLLDDTMRAGHQAYRDGQPLNCRIVVEEASLYATPVDSTTDKDVAGLSDALVDMVERARKLGIGMWFILQSVASLRDAIWKQCTTRVLGHGMTEASDLKRIENVIGPEHTILYRSVASPEASGTYTFLFSGGGLTGLSFGPKPVFLDIYTDPNEWLSDNAEWLRESRRRWAHRLPAGDPGGPLVVMPGRPARDMATQQRYKAAVRLSARGNKDGAQALLAGAQAQSAARVGFGWTTAAQDDPPPF